MIKHKNFEDFVQNEHGKQYCGCKDGCVEDFESWIEDLCFDDWILMGEKYAGYKLKEVVGDFCNLDIK